MVTLSEPHRDSITIDISSCSRTPPHFRSTCLERCVQLLCIQLVVHSHMLRYRIARDICAKLCETHCKGPSSDCTLRHRSQQCFWQCCQGYTGWVHPRYHAHANICFHLLSVVPTVQAVTEHLPVVGHHQHQANGYNTSMLKEYRKILEPSYNTQQDG